MRKRVLPRILMFMFLNCVAFVLMAGMQFARRGNFSLKINDMVINGRYGLSDEPASNEAAASAEEHTRRLLDGGVSIIFGGLEFRLTYSPDADNGFTLIDSKGGRRQVFPEYITVTDDEAVFTLPGDAELSFTSHEQGEPQSVPPELRISGKFTESIAAIDIPLKPQRYSVPHDSETKIFSITHNGSRYQFSRSPQSLETNRLLLSASAPSITYHTVSDKKVNNPADFIVRHAETVKAYSETLALWTNRNYELWNRMPPQSDEDTVIAWCAEALRKGNYRSAVSVVPAGFSSNPNRSWESSVYQFDRRTGVWETVVAAVNVSEREKISSVSKLLAEKNLNVFTENHLIDFLAIRGLNASIDALAAFAQETDPSAVSLAAGPGILESCAAMHRLAPAAANPFVPLVEQICALAAEGLYSSGDRVFVSSGGFADTVFNMRLGLALNEWGEAFGKADWAALGRSLVLSVISLDDGDGSIPVSLIINQNGEFAASAGGTSRISTARLYRLLDSNENLPHVAATGEKGILAWTAASSVSITQNDRQMDISVSFPVGETHYLMIRNIGPFPALQIYDMNWRRAYDFESYYNSSGWYYFERERTIVIKIRHRTTVERIRILFVVPTAPPPPPSSEPSPQPQSPVPPSMPEEVRPAVEGQMVPYTPPDQPSYQGNYGS